MNPYYWDFPQRADTMYMSTIQSKINASKRPQRQSTFLMKDIDGASPRRQIPQNVYRQNYNHSTFIQPRSSFEKPIKKVSNPLYHQDIEGSAPQASEFKTARIVNPLAPRYKLPSHNPIDIEPPAKFLRNTLDITDIVKKKEQRKYIKSPKQEKIVGNEPTKLFKTIDAVSRLSVRDINDQGKFFSERKNNSTNPLNPVYIWRDNTEKGLSFTNSILEQEHKTLNPLYGTINGSVSKRLIPVQSRRQSSSMNAKDIQGAHSNSFNQRRFFLDKRTEFRNYMKIDDIQKTNATSLKKGIVTNRNVNPLMPNYKFN